MNLYAVIMSGGRGKRFWPLSQEALPKQFLSFAGKGTLFQQTYARLRQIMPAENIFTVTRKSYHNLVLEQVEEFLPQNILVEPRQCNTAPCIALSLAYVASRAKDAVVAVLPSDHYIANEARFVQALQAAFDYTGERREIVTFGIQPDSPHTGFGYVQAGEETRQVNGFSIRRGERFIEKPNLETARKLVADPAYSWNSGIFCAQAEVWFEAIRQNLPIVYEDLHTFQTHIGTKDEAAALKHAFVRMPSISIDHGVMEHVTHFAVMPLQVGWSDLGSWAAMRRLYKVGEAENLLLGEHYVDQVSGATVIGPNQILVIGVNDVVVASNGKYVLVCAKDQEHRIQDMVDRLEGKV